MSYRSNGTIQLPMKLHSSSLLLVILQDTAAAWVTGEQYWSVSKIENQSRRGWWRVETHEVREAMMQASMATRAPEALHSELESY